MLKIKIHVLLFLLCYLSQIGTSAYSQKSSARATVQPSEIQIGEQAIINLQVIAPKGRNITFPIYQDTLINGIEILSMLPPDTTIAHEVMTINQKYVVTSFDSTLYHIPHMLIMDGTDSIKSNSFGFKVTSPILSDSTLAYLNLLNTQQTDSIDFEALGIADIKDVLPTPFVWQDYLIYLWISLLITLIAIILAIALYLYLRKKKKGYFFKPTVILPPHIIAIQALDKIKNEKIWQQGREKEYYTELTDILREYIEKRFSVNAFEKTTDEILYSIQQFAESDSTTASLSQILHQADLVKFAKYKPLANENDLSMVNAFLFVNQTKIEVVTESTDEMENKDQNIAKQKSVVNNMNNIKN